MPRLSRRLVASWILGGLVLIGPSARAEPDRPPVNAIGGPPAGGLHRLPPRDASRRAGSASSSSGGWWLATVGVALALAAFGGISLAARRLAPRDQAAGLQVIGRASLSPRHTVYLLRAGGRVLIVGAGSQGPPSLLGEWHEPGPARPDGGAT